MYGMRIIEREIELSKLGLGSEAVTSFRKTKSVLTLLIHFLSVDITKTRVHFDSNEGEIIEYTHGLDKDKLKQNGPLRSFTRW